MSDSGEFTCENCGGVFKKGRSDTEAWDEYRERMPEAPNDPAEAGLICEDCYQKFLRWLPDHDA